MNGLRAGSARDMDKGGPDLNVAGSVHRIGRNTLLAFKGAGGEAQCLFDKTNAESDRADHLSTPAA